MSTKKASREIYARAQRGLVSSLIYNAEMLPKVMDIIDADDIEDPSLRLIFEAMSEISRKDELVTEVSISEHLERHGNLANAGGVRGLLSLRKEGRRSILQGLPTVYARVVKDGAAKSRSAQVLEEFKPKFNDDSGFVASDAISELQGFLNEELLKMSSANTVTRLHESNDLEFYDEVIAERVRIAEENKRTDGIQGIPTPLRDLDTYTGGWKSGNMITVGAKTGQGKSIFAINTAVSAAQAGQHVLFYSLEMSRDQILDRVVSSITSIPMNAFKNGSLTEEQEKIYQEEKESIGQLKLSIDTQAEITIDTIRARALKEKQGPDELGMIIIDYLQLVKPATTTNSRQEQVASISRSVKLLAKQLGIPIMVLVQLNRNKKDEEGESLPVIDDIRESGAIAQDSDIVIFLHRDLPVDGIVQPTIVILAKNRDGETNRMIRCHSQLAYARIRQMEKNVDLDDGSNEDMDELDDLTGLEDFATEDMDDLDDLYSDDFDSEVSPVNVDSDSSDEMVEDVDLDDRSDHEVSVVDEGDYHSDTGDYGPPDEFSGNMDIPGEWDLDDGFDDFEDDE